MGIRGKTLLCPPCQPRSEHGVWTGPPFETLQTCMLEVLMTLFARRFMTSAAFSNCGPQASSRVPLVETPCSHASGIRSPGNRPAIGPSTPGDPEEGPQG